MFKRIAATAAAGCVAALLAVPTPAQAVTLDGKGPATAAASCWEIKQNNSAADSGTYWLLTPQLRTPQEFYCDMTTDGGGWVLVGRGRDGWDWGGDATGSASDLRTAVDGPEAFAPKCI